jgi:hypothetical protein
MKQLLSLSVVIASCLLLSCQKDVIQTDEESNNENLVLTAKANNVKGRPFKGSYTTSSEILQPPPNLHTRITGTGHVTQLGSGTFVALSTLVFTAQPPFNLSGTATFTSANGDEFYTRFTGTATPNNNGSLTIFNNHTITGGRGRFQNATGHFTGYTIAIPGHAEASIDYEGTISF